MNKNTTIYEALFGAYIGKMVSLSDDGYYFAGDYISGRYYTGTLESVRCKDNNLVLNLGSKEITVSDNADTDNRIMLDLNKLETKLNDALEKETVESLKLWVNMNRIIKTVCSHFSMTEGELKRKTRKREVVLPRQIAMYLAVKNTELSTDEIGGSLGKSRMTALYSFYKIRDLMKIDKQLEEQVKDMEEELYGR